MTTIHLAEKATSSAKRALFLQRFFRPFSPKSFGNIHAVVFESDDWGFCGEGKSRESHEKLSAKGYDFEQWIVIPSPKNTLENTTDLNDLFSVLQSYEDSLGRHPSFTANYVVTNPDYQRIRNDGFSKYYALPIYSGFPGSWNNRGPLQKTWKIGIEKKVWMPEFHAFSHFNYNNWLEGLRKGDKKLRDFFEEEMMASSRRFPTVSEYVVSPRDKVFADFAEQMSTVSRGLDIFRSTFGYSPRTTIPPSDIWNSDTELAFLRKNLRFIQSERTKFSPFLGLSFATFDSVVQGLKSIFLLAGPLTKLCRGARLELAEHETFPLETSRYLFRLGSPAVIGTHRVNYVSGVDPKNATLGRKKLDSLLRALASDEHIVFMTSPELFQIYSRGYSEINYDDEILVRNYTPSDVIIVKRSRHRYNTFDITKDQEVDVCQKLQDGRSSFRVPPGRTISFLPYYRN